jgi:CheY-like chemotaxis protein
MTQHLSPTLFELPDWTRDAGPPRILVVDDNPSIHRDFDLVLLESLPDSELEEQEGRMFGEPSSRVHKPLYALDHAMSGLEAVDKVKASLTGKRPYQVAFVDIRMPGIDGVEAIERIWRIDSRVQIVICTAFADYSWEDLSRRLGQTDKLLVLKKPFDTIEVTQLASTLTSKWFLARHAALKLEQMELLVARRTQRILELQRIDHHPRPTSGPWPSPDNSAQSQEPPVVMVVADTPELRAELREALSTGYRVISASEIADALDRARESVPDLVICDLASPALDGIDLCRRLKNNELTSHIPVVILTPPGANELQVRAIDGGADDCIAKPLTAPALKMRVDRLWTSRRNIDGEALAQTTLQPRELAANQIDARFFRRTLEVIETYLADFEFDVEVLARKMAVSRRQLFRKCKAVTGLTPNALIRSLRLKRAAQLLQESPMTVTEITYAVGFSDLKHFRTVFREQFGVLPGDYTRPPHLKSP